MGRHREPETKPTQVRHPWRATVRTVIALGIGLLPAAPELARATHIDTVPFIASILLIAATVERILVIPQVNAILDRWHLGATGRKEIQDESRQ